MTIPSPPSTWAERVAPIGRSRAEARTSYDGLARWYDLLEGPFERRAIRAGLRLLDVRAGERVLEVGFGTGHGLVALASAVGPSGGVVGVDLSFGMCQVARRRLDRLAPGRRPALVQADACHLPVVGASLDAVTMSFTLELMSTSDISVVLRECRRVLRADGRLSVVSLDLRPAPNAVTRLYLRTHRRWPRAVDCRPIPVADVMSDNGFAPAGQWSSTIGGLPVTAIVARPRASDGRDVGVTARSDPEG